MDPPLAVAAYAGPATWDETGWRCCRTCEVEWVGKTPCFFDGSHAGSPGRLRLFALPAERARTAAGL